MPAEPQHAVGVAVDAERPDRGSSASRSAGGRQRTSSWARSPCSGPAGCARTWLHPLRRARRRAGRARWPAPCRVASHEPQPGAVERRPGSSSPWAAPGRRRRTGGRCRPAPRGSGRPGAARAARRPSRRPAGTRRARRAGRSRARASSSSGSKSSPARRCRARPRCAAARRSGRARTARRRRGCRWCWPVMTVEVEGRAASRPGSGTACSGRRRRRPRRRAPRSVTMVPARLDSWTSSPSLRSLTSWPIRTSMLSSGSSPAQAATARSRLT